MTIPFTQFLRPNGRVKSGGFDRPALIEEKAIQLIKAGYRFECEMLTTGDIHMDCCGPRGDEDKQVATAISKNDSRIFGVVDELVELAYARVFD